MAYKKARAQARKVILQAKRSSFREYISTVNHTTPLGQVWNTVHVLSGKKTRNPITTLIFNGDVTDFPPAIANTLARQFEQASSFASFHPAFLHRKEAAEQTVPNFATGGVNIDYLRVYAG